METRREDVVSTFVDAAQAFRAVLAADDTEQLELARALRNAVARVYLAAARLPRSGSVTSDDSPDLTPDRTYSRALEQRVRARFGDADTFVDVWDPTHRERRAKAIKRSLAQELVQIDEDLARSIAWLEEPRAADTISDVWFAFEVHWGKHAVDVLRPLHHIAGGRVG